MPKDTFFRLDEHKRKLFVKKAFQEFSLNSYEGASITNLVKALGIAKGSVYQYFNDKEDLYTYLVDDAFAQLQNLLDKACPYNNEPFFEWYRKLLIVELKFFLSFPKYANLLQQVLVGTKTVDRQLALRINQISTARIRYALPVSRQSNRATLVLLSKSSLMLFSLVTEKTDLEQLITADEPLFIEPAHLLELCTQYVRQLERGLIA